jgi:peptide/nickel transport system substrate-binding protein
MVIDMIGSRIVWHRCLQLSVVALCSTLLLACQQNAESPADDDFVVGVVGVPPSLDPHQYLDPAVGVLARNVYDTLVYRDAETLEFVPGLAESWEISLDGLHYTFRLRQGITFHDGTPFDADAVRVNIERIASSPPSSDSAAELLGTLDHVEVISPYEVALVMSLPYEPLLDALTQPYLAIMSPTALAEWDDMTYQFHQVGTGPYRFVEYAIGDYVALERNPQYAWPPPVVANRSFPTIERILIRFYPDASQLAEALIDNRVQIAIGLAPEDARTNMLENRAVQLNTLALPGQPVELLLNAGRAPTSSLAVRQALFLALDRQAIAQAVYQGFATVAHGPIGPATAYYDPSVAGRFTYDPVQATALLNTSGWIDSDGDGWRDENGVPVEIVLAVESLSPEAQIAQLAKEQWESALQVPVTIETVPTHNELVVLGTGGAYHAIAYSESFLDPAMLTDLYFSTAALNLAHHTDPDLDGLLLVGQIESNPDSRAMIYSQIQGLIMDQVLVIPLAEQIQIMGSQPGVTGLHFDPHGAYPYFTDLGLGL